MRNLLPFVLNEVGYSVAAGLDDNDIKNIKKELKHIQKVNPAIAEFINGWSRNASTKDAKIHSAFCGILVYKLLESQAEADQMNTEIRLD